MKKIFSILMLISCFLGGCVSTPVSLKNAIQAPTDRVFAFQTSTKSTTASITVIRDKKYLGSGCYFALYINNILSARLDVAEFAKFNLDPGEILLKVGNDPQGRGLCGLGSEANWIQRETVLKQNDNKIFRMTFSDEAEHDIIRTDF